MSEVVIARDGVEALDYLFGTGPWVDGQARIVPQVMLLDLKLPRIDGLEVLRRVRVEPRTRFLPVVILTSSCEEQDLVASYELGANSYIQKPVNFNRFTEALGQLGLYWLLLNQVPPLQGHVT